MWLVGSVWPGGLRLPRGVMLLMAEGSTGDCVNTSEPGMFAEGEVGEDVERLLPSPHPNATSATTLGASSRRKINLVIDNQPGRSLAYCFIGPCRPARYRRTQRSTSPIRVSRVRVRTSS